MKRFVGILTVLMVLFMCTLPVAASDLSFLPSTYNEWGEAVMGPSGYQPIATIDGGTLGIGSWLTPTDMAVSPDGQQLFVLDSGNNRVTVCDHNFKNARVIDTFIDESGNESQLNEATGLFYDGKHLYIADKANNRVLRCDAEGKVSGVFEKPESALFPQEKPYLPSRVVADSNGVVYVICDGIDQGAVMYSPEGKFLGYIGSNKIQPNLSIIFNNLMKKIVSDEAKDFMEKYTPVEFTNFTIDKDNFIYTCTNVLDVAQKLKKLNSSGVNIIEAKVRSSFQRGFGDVKPPYVDGATAHSRFVDVAVDASGQIFGLDFTNMRIFVYDEDANLMFTFGGLGTKMGMFLNPVAVDLMDDHVLILDTATAQITVFKKTEFGTLVNKAMDLYGQGLYEESIEPWNNVLKYNSNYTMAYIGLGKAHMELGNIEEALGYFETAHYEQGYNDAYRILRVDTMRDNFPFYFVIVLLLLFVIYGRQIPPVKRAFHFVGKKAKELPGWIRTKLARRDTDA